MPTPETQPLRPRSPYAVSKMAGEWYVRVFAELFEIETVALRYFNVFGPRQRPDSTYAAVIPLFISALLDGQPPTVHGDGMQSRDFTFVTDVVQANLCAARAPSEVCSGNAYNIAPGATHSLIELLDMLGTITGSNVAPNFVAPRAGDIRLSRADAALANAQLDWHPTHNILDGLRETVQWVQTQRP